MFQIRRRSVLLPLAGISLLLLLVPSAWSRKTRLALVALFRPVKGVASATAALPGRILSSGETSELRTESDYQKDQIRRLTNEIAILKVRLEQVSALKQACPELDFRVLHADILLPTDSSAWRKSLTLALGSNGGVRKGMLVLYQNQLIGRVLEAGSWTSLVQLVTDPAFRAGAVAVPRGNSAGTSLEKRLVGVYEGTSGLKGQLKWILGEARLDPDGFVLTTEDPPNGVPRGLMIGRITGSLNANGASPRLEVEPVVEFRSLEHVMLLQGTK